jgi:ABC-type phosphate/phosphonate transport system substrate-binding protein
MDRIFDIVFRSIALLLMIMPGSISIAQNRQPDSVIRFGLTSSLVEADVNLDDALAATKVWAAGMVKGVGIWSSTEAAMFENVASLVAAINRGDTDIVAMGTHEYLDVQDILKAVPTLTYMQGGQVENQYLILVHRDSKFKTITDLRDQRMSRTRAGRSSMVPLWLEVFFCENGIRDCQKFFREIKEVQKPSQVILPVFFKQIECGIVLKSSFDTAVALNPQVGQQIRILASSPKLVMQVTCMRSSMAPDRIDQYVRQALKLHETPSGLQAFSMFRLDRIVPWNSAYLDNVKELIKKRKLFQSVVSTQVRPNTPSEAGKSK